MPKTTVHGGSSVDGAVDPRRASVLELRAQLRLARAGNEAFLADRTYLEADAPTAAQTREQVRTLTDQAHALTGQVDALARLYLGG
ncbi:hypothetical protein MXD62_20000 [Frankia sp. Mgl5]|uniref:hypothetical protein n=1 Tax=Frankia sp. Mgl5 TaxID=2933793 RepID=UPI00200DFB22|nr:hypothetical protein [Frankia sp. Mgl5]MCK9929434.1 hypothetical protein [Frankia sp. Mgl5]